MLTTDQIHTITVEVLTGKPPSFHSDEADKYRAELEKEAKEAKKNGIVLEIPGEWAGVE